MSSYAPNSYLTQLILRHPDGVQSKANSLSFARDGAPYYNKPFQGPEATLSSRTPMAPNLVPREVLEQRARTPCKHFEHHQGWCPFGSGCHFFHDYLRIAARGSPSTSTAPSLASSTCSSLRSSPVPSGLYQSAFVAHAPAPPRFPRVPQHEFAPRTMGGTTYFPIRLGSARLGYVTLSGVEVFTDH